MQVDLLDREMVDSDLGIANAARCSFDKMSQWDMYCGEHNQAYDNCTDLCNPNLKLRLQEKDAKLITYLATHQHWTPFAHAQEVFDIQIDDTELLYFLLNANLSGFEWPRPVNSWTVRGSLYAWLTNTTWLPEDISTDIRSYIHAHYPISYMVLRGDYKLHMLVQSKNRAIAIHQIIAPDAEELRSFTLRIHCPIFVKRQLETHRRWFVMTDIEDFSQNEVSRRYVDNEPKIYRPSKWRVQSDTRKQGSDSKRVLTPMEQVMSESDYVHSTEMALTYYEVLNRRNIAREQTRMLLPLSTYTTFWFTGSLKSWKRLFSLRLKPDVQEETREVSQMCYDAIKSIETNL